MSSAVNRKVAKSRSIKSVPTENNEKENIAETSPKSFPILPQRIIARVFMILSILGVVYYSSRQEQEKTLAKQSEILPGRGQSFDCSEAYRSEIYKYDGCFPRNCGRFVSDKIITPEEADALLQVAKKGFSLGGSDGGASILDLHSGALSKGQVFMNIYKMQNAKGLFNESDFKLFKTVKQKVLHGLMHHFGPRPNKIYLTHPTFFSQITNKKSITQHDEYWHPHVDKESYKSFHYTSLLYLNDYNVDFEGGRFIFIDNRVNHSVEPKKGRVSMFTSGAENLHRVEKVTSGVRYAVTISFTCDSAYAIQDPDVNKYTNS